MAFNLVFLLVSILHFSQIHNVLGGTYASNYGQFSSTSSNSVLSGPAPVCRDCGATETAQFQQLNTNIGQLNQQPEFEIDSIMRPGVEFVPNCGCVPLGGCGRELGEFTRLVGHYSDIVCGARFEQCCYSGPCPGVLDEFVRAAPCVPQEVCLRPYGVLPTDVRDFGIIAPCPGHGAVRCISVDDASLLQFQAAVAAIEASSNRYVAFEDEVVPVVPAPQEIIVPILPNPPAPAVVVTKPVVPAPIPQLPSSITASDIASFLAQAQKNKNRYPSSAQTMTSHTTGGETTGQITSVVSPPAATVPVTVPAVIAPPAFNFARTPQGGFDCRASGCYTPWAYRNYGAGFPYSGLGYGFRKHFSFTKGFGYGLF